MHGTLEPASQLEAALVGTTSRTKDRQPLQPVSPMTLCFQCPQGKIAGQLRPKLQVEPGGLIDRAVKASMLQVHRQHTNFIHINTKVDFSRNVLLC